MGNAENYTVIGTDTNAPYAAYVDTSGLADGTRLTFRAIANDPADDRPGRIRGDVNAGSATAVAVPKRRGTVTST